MGNGQGKQSSYYHGHDTHMQSKARSRSLSKLPRLAEANEERQLIPKTLLFRERYQGDVACETGLPDLFHSAASRTQR